MRLETQQKSLPTLDRLELNYRGRAISIPYFLRRGSGPAILFIHGLGGAKENFYAAFQTAALNQCMLVAFDNPGTGLAGFDPAQSLDVSALAEIAHLVSERLMPEHYFNNRGEHGRFDCLAETAEPWRARNRRVCEY